MFNRWVYVTTLFLGRLSPVRNWQLHGPSWISGRERMTVENVSCSLSMSECCLTRRGSSPRPPDHSGSDVRRTEPPRPADILSGNCEGHAFWTLVSATCSFSSIGWPKWHILYATWVALYYFFCTPGFGVVGFRCGRISVWSGFGVVGFRCGACVCGTAGAEFAHILLIWCFAFDMCLYILNPCHAE